MTARMTARLWVAVILLAVAGLFMVQNVAVVQIRFLAWSVEVPRALLLFAVLAVGLIAGWFLHGYVNYRHRHGK